MAKKKYTDAGVHVGVGITFEPDIGYGSSTYGMHVVTKIRPYSPAHKSKQRTNSTLPHPLRPEIFLLEFVWKSMCARFSWHMGGLQRQHVSKSICTYLDHCTHVVTSPALSTDG